MQKKLLPECHGEILHLVWAEIVLLISGGARRGKKWALSQGRAVENLEGHLKRFLSQGTI